MKCVHLMIQLTSEVRPHKFVVLDYIVCVSHNKCITLRGLEHNSYCNFALIPNTRQIIETFVT